MRTGTKKTIEKRPAKIVARQDFLVPLEQPIPKPKNLSKAASEQWEIIYPMLVEARVLRQVDVFALACLCDASATLAHTNKMIEDKGLLWKSGDGEIRRNPYLLIRQRAQDEVMALWKEFGMTPLSRSKMCKEAPPPEADNVFAANGARPQLKSVG